MIDRHISGFLLLFLSVVIFSCGKKSEYKSPVFRDMGTITGDTIVRDIMCTDVFSIYIQDSLLITECINSIDKKAFYIYNRHTGQLLRTFGIYGNGPGELPNSFSHAFDKANNILYVMGGKTGLAFHLDSVLLDSNYRTDTQVTLNTIKNGTAFFCYNDSLFFSTNDFRPDRDYRLAIINPENDTVTCYRKLETFRDIADAAHMEQAAFYTLRTFGSMKPDKSKFVTATGCGLIMELFDLDGGKIKLADVRRFIEPQYDVRSMRNNGVIPGLIWSLEATDNYIYGLWSTDTEKNRPEELVTFTWKGEPVSKYTFGKGAAGSWAVDNDSEVYITIKDSLGRLNIVRYTLPAS